MSSLRCGARHRCSFGPPPAASILTSSRLELRDSTLGLVEHDRETVAGDGDLLVVLLSFRGFILSHRGDGRSIAAGNLELCRGDLETRLCP